MHIVERSLEWLQFLFLSFVPSFRSDAMRFKWPSERISDERMMRLHFKTKVQLDMAIIQNE